MKGLNDQSYRKLFGLHIDEKLFGLHIDEKIVGLSISQWLPCPLAIRNLLFGMAILLNVESSWEI